MNTECTLHLRGDDAVEVERHDSLRANWLSIKVNDTEITIFCTPAQLDSFIERIAALRRETV